MIALSEFRVTRQRTVILEELRKVRSHPTARDVYEMVRRKLPRISLGTVYRNLDLLCAQGQILKLATQGGLKNRFDGNADNHSHVECVSCGRVDDLGFSPHASLEGSAAADTGYLIVGHRLEFLGICPACQARGHPAHP